MFQRGEDVSPLVAAPVTMPYATSPSSTESSIPLMVTVCGVFQFSALKTRLAVEIVPSAVLLLLSGTVTLTVTHADGTLKGRWDPEDPYFKTFALIRIAALDACVISAAGEVVKKVPAVPSGPTKLKGPLTELLPATWNVIEVFAGVDAFHERVDQMGVTPAQWRRMHGRPAAETLGLQRDGNLGKHQPSDNRQI